MDKQKAIPPVSKKITRKLASESADHNSLMNYYSAISRDETGAPKKWKMSSSLKIDEQLITSGKIGSAKSSPASSRESSSERRGRQSLQGTRSSSRDSSSELGSSRDSSTESRGKSDKPERSRSLSQINGTTDIKKKRGRPGGRPKSLDLSTSKSVVNGDDDKFKSPDPLTPCNVAVKRRKGRPKETPPTLVAETAVIATEGLDGTAVDCPNPDIDDNKQKSEQDNETGPKRKTGRTARPEKTTINAQKTVKQAKFGLKRKVTKLGIKKLPKLTKMKTAVIPLEPEVENSGTSVVAQVIDKSNDLDKIETDIVDNSKASYGNSETESDVVKRKPGRPPGAKNKPKLDLLIKKRRKGALVKGALIAGKGKSKAKTNGKTDELKEVVKKTKKIESSETNGESKPNGEEKTITNETDLDDMWVDEEMFPDFSTENINDENVQIALDGSSDVKECPSPEEMSKNLDEAINSVVYKAGNDLPLPVHSKKDNSNLRLKHGVASLGKLKKIREMVHKVRKKKILQHHKHVDSRTVDVLAPNDLRRKLHEKVLQQKTSPYPELSEKKLTVNEVKTDVEMDGEGEVKEMFSANVFYSKNEQKPTVNEQLSKGVITGRKQSIDLGDSKKFSDTDSICSEVSITSHGSTKRAADKQIIVLGEENVDSDDSSIRTRQRFDIVPGKKRKRTLSGEFDLLDEKLLRRSRKKSEKVDGDMVSDNEDNIKKETKKAKLSPKSLGIKMRAQTMALKDKYGTLFKARKVSLLRQSPFLTSKRRGKKWGKRKLPISPIKNPANHFETKETVDNQHDENKSDSESKTDRENLFTQFGGVSSIHSSPEMCPQTLKELCQFALDVKTNEPKSETEENISESVIKTEDKKIEDVKTGDEKTEDVKSEDIKAEDMKTDIVETDKEQTLSDKDVLGADSVVNSLLKELIDKVVCTCEPSITNIDETSENVIENTTNTEMDVNLSVPQTGLNKSARGRRWKRGRPGAKLHRTLSMVRKSQPFESKRGSRGRGRGRGRCKAVFARNTLDSSTVVGSELSSELVSDSKLSPDSLITRKIELRQKISRSPLDNIALKQSKEETKYLKAEQQRAIRKETKMKSKLKSNSEDSMDSTQSGFSDVVTDQTEQLAEESEINKSNIEEMKKVCRPCSIVLFDFIKKLQDQATPDTESDENDWSQDEAAGVENTVNKSPEVKDSEDKTNEMKDNTKAETKSEDCKNDTQTATQSVTESKVSPTRVKKSETKDESKPDPNVKNEIVKEGSCQTIDQKVPSSKAPIKMKRTGRKSLMYEREMIPKQLIIAEQQTARKTVPPLKIKVKGVKRKTYMVEPHPDSPVDHDAEAKSKPEKKRKAKSGNKSESSDSEKHGKTHHHHKKRNKSPPANEAKTNTVVNQTKKPSPPKQLKPTDAYEANFLQFIQDSSKASPKIEHMAPYNVKKFGLGRHVGGMIPKMTKPEQNNNTTSTTNVTSTPVTSTAPVLSKSPGTSKTVTSGVTSQPQPVKGLVGPNTFPEVGVKFLCILCNVEYMSQELISKHFAEVHPGMQFMFKPQPELHTEQELIMPSQASTVQKPPPPPAPAPRINHQPSIKSVPTHTSDKVDDDDDSGSLDLKIVNVVSLKDQENFMEFPSTLPKPATPVETLSINPQSRSTKTVPSTELRVPQYISTHNIVPSLNSSVANVDPNAELYKHLLKTSRPLNMMPRVPKSTGLTGQMVNTFKCEKCNVHAPQLGTMVGHLRNIHREIPRLFQCPYCKDTEAESEAMIHQHIKTFHPTNNPNPPVALSEPAKRNLKTLAVPIPPNVKPDENALDRDIYQCLVCQIHMFSHEMIYEHLEKSHPDVFVYMCPFCKEYKSKTEDGVCAHILHVHRKSTVDVSISIAIDGFRFNRVQCLKKQHSAASTSTLSSQKPTTNPSSTSVLSQPKPTSIPNHFAAHQQSLLTRLSHIPTPTQNHLQTIAAATQNFPKHATVQPQVPAIPTPMPQPVTTASLSHNTTTSTSLPNKPTPPPGPKKKRNLLESIQQLKAQKGLLDSDASQSSPSPPKKMCGVPPPLMKAPPPLIRFDQLNKLSNSTPMASTTVKMSTSATYHKAPGSIGQDALSSLQRLQSLSGSMSHVSFPSNAKPIQSSLFDTSDMGGGLGPNSSIKSAHRPVLNVPVVSRSTVSPSVSGGVGGYSIPRPVDASFGAGILDLSAKSTPSSSPAPHKSSSPNKPQNPSPKDLMAPDMFKVFNIRPQNLIPSSRPSQNSAVMSPPLVLPQQVRPNTPSTLAYRPPGAQMVATSQIPHIINMPMGAVFGNMVVSLANVPGGVTALPGGMTALQGLPAQLVPVGAPASAVSTSLPVVNPTTPGAQMFSTIFKCPYCPKVVPLNFAEVTPHIESQHPGSSILFLPMTAK